MDNTLQAIVLGGLALLSLVAVILLLVRTHKAVAMIRPPSAWIIGRPRGCPQG